MKKIDFRIRWSKIDIYTAGKMNIYTAGLASIRNVKLR